MKRSYKELSKRLMREKELKVVGQKMEMKKKLLVSYLSFEASPEEKSALTAKSSNPLFRHTPKHFESN